MARNFFCSGQKGVDAPQKSAGFSFGAGNVEITASNNFSKVRFHYKWLALLCGIFYQLCVAPRFAAQVDRQRERT